MGQHEVYQALKKVKNWISTNEIVVTITLITKEETTRKNVSTSLNRMYKYNEVERKIENGIYLWRLKVGSN